MAFVFLFGIRRTRHFVRTVEILVEAWSLAGMQNLEDCFGELMVFRFLDLLNLMLDEIYDPLLDIFVGLREIILDCLCKESLLLWFLLKNASLFDPELTFSGKLTRPQLISPELTFFESYDFNVFCISQAPRIVFADEVEIS